MDSIDISSVDMVECFFCRISFRFRTTKVWNIREGVIGLPVSYYYYFVSINTIFVTMRQFSDYFVTILTAFVEIMFLRGPITFEYDS